jgi:ELWxxDGT repeat protein
LLVALAGAAMLASLLAATVLAAPGDVTATKVKDIAAVDGSSPDWLTGVNATLYFSADDGTNGVELWKSDGSPAGTTMVVPAGGIGPAGASSIPTDLENVNGTLYFAANDGTNGFELWKSDGSSGGTTIVTPGGGINANPGPSASSAPHELTNVNGTLLFAAFTGNSGNELWKTDGTPTGTELVMDINPGNTEDPPFEDSSNPGELTSVGSTLYFSAYDGIKGAELWKSVPPYDDATMVKDINTGNAGADSSNPMELTNAGGTLYFNADDGTNGQELWKSDGTELGTTMVDDATPDAGIHPGAQGSSPSSLTDVNGTLFFAADDGANGDELWRSDGTPSGTTLVEDSIPGGGINPGSAGSFPDDLDNVNGTVFFAADDGTTGTEPWKSDGTPSGTKIVADGIPGANGSSPQFFAHVNGTAFFQAVDDTNGIELWKSDGTPTGTAVVEDAIPGGGINSIPSAAADSLPDSLTNVNGTLFFSAQDAPNNTELWKATVEPTVEPTTPTITVPPAVAPLPTLTKMKKCKKKHKRASNAKKKKCKKKKKR